MSYGSLWQRWSRGVSWTWINEQYRARLPDDLGANVMTLESRDRFHAKQGRSTARVVLDRADRPLAVYLKRHFRLPWPARLAALVDPAGKHSPAAAEWAHLERARALGIDVPEVVAAGERIGPWADLRSFLMIAELTGCDAVNELLPQLAARARCPGLRDAETPAHRRNGADHRDLARGPRLPQRPVSLPLFPRSRWPRPADGRSPRQLDRPAPAQANTGSGPTGGDGKTWASCSSRRTASPASPTATACDSGGSYRRLVGIRPAGLACADGPAQGGALPGAQPQAALKADAELDGNPSGRDRSRSDNTKWWSGMPSGQLDVRRLQARAFPSSGTPDSGSLRGD